MTVERPRLSNVPKQIAFNEKFTVHVAIPPHLSLGGSSIQGVSNILRIVQYDGTDLLQWH